MSIEKGFNDLKSSIIFDPIPSYGGIWFFSLENLFRNSKKENGKNLFEEFYKKTFIEPLSQIFDIKAIEDMTIGLESVPNENNIGRCLKYSKVDFFAEIISFLNQPFDKYGRTPEEINAFKEKLIGVIDKSNEEINNVYAEAFKEKQRKLKDVLDNEINSEYFDAAMDNYATYKNIMDFTTFIKVSYETISKFQLGFLKLGDFFDRKIDYREMYKCFDVDTFYLLFAKIIYEYNLRSEEVFGKLDNNKNYLYFYNIACEDEIKKDKDYNPKILYTLKSGKKIQYSRRNFQIDFQEMMQRHPEVTQIYLPNLDDETQEKYRDISLVEKLSELYRNEAKVNWEFLPKGESIKKAPTTKESILKEQKSVSKEDLIYETNMRISILEKSGFVGMPVRGLDTFSGYYAFIYPNGVVILEKFWENEEDLNPAVGCATYVMNIDNFIEMSKVAKIDLIQYMKTVPEIGVKRIFHTSINNWQRNLYSCINGSYRLEDAIEFIESLKTGERKDE